MLTKRLQKIVELLPKGKTVADIGTDHAYLPIYVINNRVAPKVIAVELNPGPLETARKNIEKYGLEDRIEVRMGDGLQPISSDEAEVVIIAGVGGGTINGILQADKEKALTFQKIVLQPMSNARLVRSYLQSHGFRLEDEELVFEDGQYYEIIVAEPGESYEVDDIMLEIGPVLFKKKHPLLADFLEEKIFSYRRTIDNLGRSSKVGAREKQKYLEEKIKYLEKVISCL